MLDIHHKAYMYVWEWNEKKKQKTKKQQAECCILYVTKNPENSVAE